MALQERGVITEGSAHARLSMMLPALGDGWALPATDGACVFHGADDDDDDQLAAQQSLDPTQRRQRASSASKRRRRSEASAAASSGIGGMRKRRGSAAASAAGDGSPGGVGAGDGAAAMAAAPMVDDRAVKHAFFRRLLGRFLPDLGFRAPLPIAVLDQGGLADPTEQIDCFAGFAASAVVAQLTRCCLEHAAIAAAARRHRAQRQQRSANGDVDVDGGGGASSAATAAATRTASPSVAPVPAYDPSHCEAAAGADHTLCVSLDTWFDIRGLLL